MLRKLLVFLLMGCTTLSSFSQWTQLGESLYGTADVSGRFGRAVSLSGDGSVLAVGSPRFGDELDELGNPDESGIIRIYEKDASDAWIENTNIQGLVPEEFFGRSLELNSDGTVLIVGAPGDINSTDIDGKGVTRVYEKNINGTWDQVGGDIIGENNNEYSGWSVSISDDGNTIAVGAWGYSNETGTARIYARDASNMWIKQADLIGTDSGDRTGFSVSLSKDGNIAAVGAYEHDVNKGTTRVYERNMDNTWSQIGADIDGESTDENAGFSVDLSQDGNVIAIGAYGFNAGDGTARIYENQSGIWTKITQIDGTPTEGEDFGYSLYLTPDASTLAIGGRSYDFSNGVTRIYENSGSTWSQVGNDITSGADPYSFVFSSTALSLSDSGTVIAIGAYAFNNTGGFTNDGSVQVHVFDRTLSIQDYVDSDFSYFIQNQKLYTTSKNVSIRLFDFLGKRIKNDYLKGLYVVYFTDEINGIEIAKKIYVN